MYVRARMHMIKEVLLARNGISKRFLAGVRQETVKIKQGDFVVCTDATQGILHRRQYAQRAHVLFQRTDKRIASICMSSEL